MAKPKAKIDQLQNREISTSELAVIVGKSPQWIRQLTRENVLVQIGRGKYSLGEVVQAYIKHIFTKPHMWRKSIEATSHLALEGLLVVPILVTTYFLVWCQSGTKLFIRW
ncbi:type IV toxin-antitoxin system AbiEi family antitoxin domain-containing protein [Brevibacillus brevis]|uniref:Helix-turn-helix domain-containing protein n=1 Tax=Brevibacillus brevis TaxID=1393 RepID=A0A517I2V2_BREBE|nr:type IV toxin-antitoxin system AbiEi family antitoxin domain-containing protein [Brevibacillus brevis]QDS33238.1 hypothetical protein FPS98_04155 [Brevibacillus brevis]